MKTDEARYAERLAARETVWWKRLLGAQQPYRWHLRRLNLGFVLDVGCGTGRNLLHLGGRSAGVGVDRNPAAVAIARRRGLVAYSTGAFRHAPEATPGRFDSLLLSHVLEHMSEGEAGELLRSYLDLLRPRGKIVVIAPQEAGFRSDPTHVEFLDSARIERLLAAQHCRCVASYSFPFPRSFGRFFRYNETVVLAELARPVPAVPVEAQPAT